MWPLILAGAVKGALGNVLSGAKQMAAIENKVSAANAEAANKVRAASSASLAAQASLDRWTQSVENSRRLRAGGAALEANTVNLLRQRDANTIRTLSGEIEQAEQFGNAAAVAAFSGIGGEVVDMVNSTTSLRNAIIEQRAADVQHMVDFDALRQQGNIMQSMVEGLDSSIVIESLDYGRNVATVKKVPSVLQSALTSGLGAAIGSVAAGWNPFAKDAETVSKYSLTRAGGAFGERPGTAGTYSIGTAPNAGRGFKFAPVQQPFGLI